MSTQDFVSLAFMLGVVVGLGIATWITRRIFKP